MHAYRLIWNAQLKYLVARNLAIYGNYDSDHAWGAGISLIY
ncbi:MAG: hypothetical protein ABI691_15105 [Ginsengibacter sp.]